MSPSDFEHRNEEEYCVPDLAELNKNLKLKSDDYERLEYLESVKTEHQEWVYHCSLEIKKIKKLHEYKKEYHSCPSPLPSFPPKNGIPKLSLSQIALKYVWEGQCISIETCDEIARQYGHTSGQALYNKYCNYSNNAFRKAFSDLSKKQLKNKINLFESVIDLLPESKKNKAREELDSLLNKLEENY